MIIGAEAYVLEVMSLPESDSLDAALENLLDTALDEELVSV